MSGLSVESYSIPEVRESSLLSSVLQDARENDNDTTIKSAPKNAAALPKEKRVLFMEILRNPGLRRFQ